MPPQLQATPGMPERKAVARRQARVREILHTLPPAAQAAILEELDGSGQPDAQADAASYYDGPTTRHDRSIEDDAPTGAIEVPRQV